MMSLMYFKTLLLDIILVPDAKHDTVLRFIIRRGGTKAKEDLRGKKEKEMTTRHACL